MLSTDKSKIEKDYTNMGERIIIKSEHYNLKRYIKIVIIIGVTLILIGFLLYACNFNGCRMVRGDNGSLKYLYSIIDNMLYPSSLEAGIFIDIGLIVIVLALLGVWCLASYELTVTNKRVFGKTSFGKRVDLPIDSISAIGTSALKGITISTASGRIFFKLIKNHDEIHSEISNLIISRQSKSNNDVTEPSISTNITDELKKYKELLDIGAITQEEFNAKKKELLGL